MLRFPAFSGMCTRLQTRARTNGSVYRYVIYRVRVRRKKKLGHCQVHMQNHKQRNPERNRFGLDTALCPQSSTSSIHISAKGFGVETAGRSGASATHGTKPARLHVGSRTKTTTARVYSATKSPCKTRLTKDGQKAHPTAPPRYAGSRANHGASACAPPLEDRAARTPCRRIPLQVRQRRPRQKPAPTELGAVHGRPRDTPREDTSGRSARRARRPRRPGAHSIPPTSLGTSDMLAYTMRRRARHHRPRRCAPASVAAAHTPRSATYGRACLAKQDTCASVQKRTVAAHGVRLALPITV
jgi:hypothetical protein